MKTVMLKAVFGKTFYMSVLLALSLGCHQIVTAQEASSMSNTAENYVAAFRRGEKFNAPSQGMLSGGQLDPQAAAVFGKALAEEGSDVREQIVLLLRDVAKRANPGHPSELRDPEIIALFAGSGLAKPDRARSRAIGSLLHAMPARLQKYGNAFARALEVEPEYLAFLLVAHAKAFQAQSIVERSKWDTTAFADVVRIARAALGNMEVEDEFLEAVRRAEEAGDAERLAQGPHVLLNPLGRIGTRRSLRAVAKFMRSPLELVVGHQNLGRKSIRLAAMAALKFAFPDQADTLLHEGNIRSDNDYQAVEDFCIRELGVSYEGMPRPRFLTTSPSPAPMPQ